MDTRTRARLIWAGQWTAALGFFLVAMVHLGLENRVCALDAFEIALSLIAILPAMTAVVPELSTGALAARSVVGAALSGPGICPARARITLTIVAAAVAFVRFRVGYGLDARSGQPDRGRV